MLERMRDLATLSVARGCGFAAFAIACTMIGFAADLVASLKTGGVLALIVCVALVVKAMRAPRFPYKSTELWIMLDPPERPQPAVAQRIVGTLLREIYLRFAGHFAAAAAVLFGFAGMASFIRALTA